jgi:hypothetical protein
VTAWLSLQALAEAAKDRQPVLRQNRIASSITKRINHADALRQDVGSLNVRLSDGVFGTPRGLCCAGGSREVRVHTAIEHSSSFDCPDCLCGASLVSDGEVL